MKKYPNWSYIAGTTAMLCLLITMFFTSFQVTVFDRGFVDKEMIKFGVADRIGMTQEGLMELYDELLKYLEDNRDDLDITIQRNGQQMTAFYEKEILHMIDVKVLVLGAFTIRNVAAVTALALILLICLWRGPQGRIWKVLLPTFLIAAGVFFAAIAVLGIAIAIDFDRAFILFHQLLFTNDLWQLNYATDLLMNIVPESFSYDVAVRTIVYFVSVFVPMLVAGIIGFVRDRRK